MRYEVQKLKEAVKMHGKPSLSIGCSFCRIFVNFDLSLSCSSCPLDYTPHFTCGTVREHLRRDYKQIAIRELNKLKLRTASQATVNRIIKLVTIGLY